MGCVAAVSNWTNKQLESSLLPSKACVVLRVAIYAYQFFKFCLFLPLAIAFSLISFVATRIFPEKDSPLVAFAKNPTWTEGPAQIPRKQNGEPIAIGFSTADIQDSGPNQPQFRGTNWGNHYLAHSAEIDLTGLPDTLNHPQQLIDELREIGMNHWRTSISLMPKKGREVDELTLQRYCNFFRTLRDAGIELMVTLNHFVHPDDFDWKDPESIERMVNFAERVAEPLYQAGIRDIIVTNELAVMAVQSHVMGKFPPYKTFDIEGACQVMENMLRAQVAVYQRLKPLHPDFQISPTHDPIRFRNFHKCNPLWAPGEKIMCHYLTEIFHAAVMRFLQTGKFSCQVPFRANYSFEIPEFVTRRPYDKIGLQYYTDPLLKFPSGSATRVEGENLSTYKYRMYPQGIATALEEFATLGVPIDITEVGIDKGVNKNGNDQERIAYFTKLFQAVQKAIDHGVDVRSMHFWTKNRSWEWNNTEVDFAFTPETTTWLQGCLAAARAPAQAVV